MARKKKISWFIHFAKKAAGYAGRFMIFVVTVLILALSGCATTSPQSVSQRGVKYDARVLWTVLENYIADHPKLSFTQLSKVTVADLVKGGYIPQRTVTGWEQSGLDVSIHPENYRMPKDGVVCQISDGKSFVVATRSGEIKGYIP